MEPTIEQRLLMRERPIGRPVMHQRWVDLTFLHWEIPAEQLQAVVPAGLTIDTFEGKAYVGLVPFAMRDVRPAWSPKVRGLSHFLETNVRTYVHREGKQAGVWFFSLDAANRAGAWLGRNWFKLPYHYAQMGLEAPAPGTFLYGGIRQSDPTTEYMLETVVQGDLHTAEPGGFEFFLIERYLLYTTQGNRLLAGRVWHEPYQVAEASANVSNESLLAANRIVRPNTAPIVHYSPGVTVEVFRLQSSE